MGQTMPLSTILETLIRQYLFSCTAKATENTGRRSIQLHQKVKYIMKAVFLRETLLTFKPLLMSNLIYCKSLLLSGNDLIKSQSIFFPFMI